MKKLFSIVAFAALMLTTFSISGCLPPRPGMQPHHPHHGHHRP